MKNACYICDLEVDTMTLIYETDLQFLKMYRHSKNETFCRFKYLKI